MQFYTLEFIHFRTCSLCLRWKEWGQEYWLAIFGDLLVWVSTLPCFKGIRNEHTRIHNKGFYLKYWLSSYICLFQAPTGLDCLSAVELLYYTIKIVSFYFTGNSFSIHFGYLQNRRVFLSAVSGKSDRKLIMQSFYTSLSNWSFGSLILFSTAVFFLLQTKCSTWWRYWVNAILFY